MFILCVAVIAGNSMGVVKASKVYQEHWTYELINGDSEVKILMYNDPTVTELVIPSRIEGKPVTQIGEQAFSWYEDGIYFTNLEKVTIPEGVKSIGKKAFYNCIKLESVNLPESVKSIDFWAFRDCTSLKNVTISEGAKIIDSLAFADCSSLTSVEIPKSVYFISDKNPFADCSSLETINVAEDNDGGFIGNSNALIRMLGEGENEEIDAIIFSGCKNTVIPESLSRIEINDYAFSGCTGLKSIPFEKIKKVGDCAFRGCSGLETLVVADGNADYESKDNTVIKKDTKQVVFGCKNSVIPDDAASIGKKAFSGDKKLKKLIFKCDILYFSFDYCYERIQKH